MGFIRKMSLIYNFALAERIKSWKGNKTKITYSKQQKNLPLLKKKYPEYKWVYSKELTSRIQLRNVVSVVFELKEKFQNELLYVIVEIP